MKALEYEACFRAQHVVTNCRRAHVRVESEYYGFDPTGSAVFINCSTIARKISICLSIRFYFSTVIEVVLNFQFAFFSVRLLLYVTALFLYHDEC